MQKGFLTVKINSFFFKLLYTNIGGFINQQKKVWLSKDELILLWSCLQVQRNVFNVCNSCVTDNNNENISCSSYDL